MDRDLAEHPWDYPGTAVPCSGLLEGGRFIRAAPEELLRANRSRRPVVAVGSNAAATVMQRKLDGHGVGGVVPFVAGTLTGCAVGHSAHVSVPGYVAAAPYDAVDAVTPVLVSLLDRQQMACLDQSEPNYVRRVVRRGRYVLDLAGGTQPATFDLYDSRWGVLARPDDLVVPFGSQEDLHAYLRVHWPPYRALLDDALAVTGSSRSQKQHAGTLTTPLDRDDARSGDRSKRPRVRHVMVRLALDADLRKRVRDAFRETGWTRPSGLAGWPHACA